ncbi:MAG: uroporphyrinogen-III C-methyltransferase [Bacteroidota bacterium]
MSQPLFPKLTLVGAGPGDPDLISVKGIRALQTADVVLYDALVNEELLQYAPAEAARIFVGKRLGQHEFHQSKINELIVVMAHIHGHVVRLKGGDPFVFGRGHEEIAYARQNDLETAIVPGISSSIAVPELQGIPLTSRGISESFWVLTGTTRTGAISADIDLAAQSNATAVILMGVHKIREITAIYQHYGKGEIPVAIIQNGSQPNERFVLANIDTIVAEMQKEGVGSPAVIVIGEVVRQHPAYVREHVADCTKAYFGII